LILFVLTFFHLSLFHVSSTVAYNVIYNNGLIFSNQPANWIGRAVSNELKVTFATGNHSAEPLMLFAIGPCSEAFIGFLDNTDPAKIMNQACGVEAIRLCTDNRFN
jgi:alkaline phosphatase